MRKRYADTMLRIPDDSIRVRVEQKALEMLDDMMPAKVVVRAPNKSCRCPSCGYEMPRANEFPCKSILCPFCELNMHPVRELVHSENYRSCVSALMNRMGHLAHRVFASQKKSTQ